MTAIPNDYDDDPGRFGSVRQGAVGREHPRGDVHPGASARLAEVGCRRTLDIGGGTGTLARLLAELGVWSVVLDQSFAQLMQASSPKVRADGNALPFASESFDAVAALWALYHFAHPVTAMQEARRVLREDGWFVACAPSRWNNPELAEHLPAFGAATSFDAEVAPDLVGEVFDKVQVKAWDAPLLTLRDPAELRAFLRLQRSPTQAVDAALENLSLPLPITKRGCLVWASK